MSLIVALVFATLVYYGYSYYNTSMVDRFYSPEHQMLKPSGPIGHGLGIIGSLFMFIGVSIYMIRKRMKIFSRLGKLKYWLEFHIFLCTLGPLLVLFHTSFKIGGLVAISFWSMIAVFASGVIGRFIYIQIPRTIEGRELSLNEVRGLRTDIGGILKSDYNLDDESYKVVVELADKKIEVVGGTAIVRFFKKYYASNSNLRKIKRVLKKGGLNSSEYGQIVRLVKNEILLNRKIDRLNTMQNLFKYWHVVHLPFAIIMLFIMIIHVIVTMTLGYRWLF